MKTAKSNGDRWLTIKSPELPPFNAPDLITGELHYLYALLIFSDAFPDADLEYTEDTECGRIEYERDGVPWVMIIRRRDEGMM